MKNNHFQVSIWLVFSLLPNFGYGGIPPSFGTLKRDLARKFMDPRAPMRFAKALVARGREASAFSVLEYARRVVFSREKRAFREAHQEVFLNEEPFDNGHAAERVCKK